MQSTENSDTSLGAGSLEKKAFDFVVVGAGAGGGPLACRLAEAGFDVLLIDSGSNADDNPLVKIPGFNAKSTEVEDISWSYMVDHYEDELQQIRDFKSQEVDSKYSGVLYPRAAAIGGCTTHHALIQMYPHDVDWSNLAELTGDTKWAPENMRRLYRDKIERCLFYGETDKDTLAMMGHGHNGWLPTQRRSLGVFVRKDSKVVDLIRSCCNFTFETGRVPATVKEQISSGESYFDRIVEGGISQPGEYNFTLDSNHEQF